MRKLNRVLLQRTANFGYCGGSRIDYAYDVLLRDGTYYYGPAEPEGQLTLRCVEDRFTDDSYIEADYLVYGKIILGLDRHLGGRFFLMNYWQADRSNPIAKVHFGIVAHHNKKHGWDKSRHDARRLLQALLLDLHTMDGKRYSEAMRQTAGDKGFPPRNRHDMAMLEMKRFVAKEEWLEYHREKLARPPNETNCKETRACMNTG